MAAKFDRDPRKAAAYYQKMQPRYAGRIYRRDNKVSAKSRHVQAHSMGRPTTAKEHDLTKGYAIMRD